MLLFFDLGTGEIILILIVLFVVVGPRQLPEVARTVGKAINEMKRASAGFRNEIQKEAMRLERETGLNELKNPLKHNAVQTSVPPDAGQENFTDAPVDDFGAIPFGTAPETSEEQNNADSNKS